MKARCRRCCTSSASRPPSRTSSPSTAGVAATCAACVRPRTARPVLLVLVATLCRSWSTCRQRPGLVALRRGLSAVVLAAHALLPAGADDSRPGPLPGPDTGGRTQIRNEAAYDRTFTSSAYGRPHAPVESTMTWVGTLLAKHTDPPAVLTVVPFGDVSPTR